LLSPCLLPTGNGICMARNASARKLPLPRLPDHIARTISVSIASNLAVHTACVLHLCCAAVILPGQLPSGGVAVITVGFARLSVMQLAGLCTRAVSCRLPVPCSRSCGAHLLFAVHVFGVPRVAGFGVVTVLVGGARAAPAVSTVTGGVPLWTVGYVLAGRAGRQVVVPIVPPTLTIDRRAHPPAIIADERNVSTGVCPPVCPSTHDAAIFGRTGAARDSWAGEPEVIPPNLSASACACGLCWPWVALRVARLARRRAGGAVRSAAGWYVRVLHCGMTPTRRPLAAVCALPARCAVACVPPPVSGARAAVLARRVVTACRVGTF
jgi:hypothetical protein